MGSRVSARSRAGKARAAAAVVEVARNERRSMLTSLGAATLDLSSVFVNALVDHDGRAGKAPHRSDRARYEVFGCSVLGVVTGTRRAPNSARNAPRRWPEHVSLPNPDGESTSCVLRRRKLSPRL